MGALIKRVPQVPFPKNRSPWPLVLVPFSMGIFYLFIVYPRFCSNLSIIWEHLFVLSFWILTTLMIMFFGRNLLIRLHTRAVVIPAVLVPALSCFFLHVIYTSSILGDIYWEDTLDYKQILPFIPHLFELAKAFQLPPALIVAFLAAPLIFFIVLFQGRIRSLIIWHWALWETYILLDPRTRLKWTLFGTLSWAFAFVAIFTANPSIPGFINFNHEPIINFFKAKHSFFAMSKERVFWAQKDKLTDLRVRAHTPQVHNVFIFVIDALRADHLPIYGYSRPLTPFLSDFFPKAHARKIEMALSTGLETVTGTVCLMTSKNPDAMSQYNYTLPDYMYDQGYKTYLILAGSHSWQLAHGAFGKKIDLFYDGSENPGPNGVCDDQLVLDEVANLKPFDGGYHFFYFHLVSVHPLGYLDKKYEVYQPVRNIVIDDSIFSGRPVDQIVNMYDDRILQMDDVMKDLLGALRQKGYLNDYVAVLTADHGQLLGEKGKYGHGHFSDIGGIHIPMVFFGSKSLPPFPESHFAVQLDVASTLSDLAVRDFPAEAWQGQSLLRKRTNPWSYHFSPYTKNGQEGAVVYFDLGKLLKFGRILDESEEDKGKLFDLDKDPEEKKDIINDFDPGFLNAIRAKALEHFTTN